MTIAQAIGVLLALLLVDLFGLAVHELGWKAAVGTLTFGVALVVVGIGGALLVAGGPVAAP